MVQYRPPEGATGRSRLLRRRPTDAETRMWRLLRLCFPEAHFRRQVPIRRFTADFASHRLKLVIEVDGGQHSEDSDKDRTALIEAEGYRIDRFWNHDVLGNADGVATLLAACCGDATPTPTLPHQGRGS
ncbi:MAG TPA: endonuclease domain-containing protein [Allosphingosinicella sp.]|nr:endonuclease domain-containing protein [Allosphingosinicella sp.]